jgi:polyphenol oxidase
MSWVLQDNYCINENLYSLEVPHFITTKKAGNMKNENNIISFFNNINKKFQKEIFDYKNFYRCIQTHSSTCHKITNKQKNNIIPNCDALFTSETLYALGIFTADCVPLFIVDKSNKVFALVHAGWRGAKDGIVLNMMNLLKQNYNTSDYIFVFGPHLKECCYEFGEEYKKDFNLVSRNVKGENKYFLNLENYIINQLLNLGIKENKIFKSNYCTGCNNDLFFSYRFNNKTDDRMLSGIGGKKY